MTTHTAPTCDRGPGYCHDCPGCTRRLAWQMGFTLAEADHFARWVRASHIGDEDSQIAMLTAIIDPDLEWPATIDDLYTDTERLTASVQDTTDAFAERFVAPLARWLDRHPRVVAVIDRVHRPLWTVWKAVLVAYLVVSVVAVMLLVTGTIQT